MRSLLVEMIPERNCCYLLFKTPTRRQKNSKRVRASLLLKRLAPMLQWRQIYQNRTPFPQWKKKEKLHHWSLLVDNITLIGKSLVKHHDMLQLATWRWLMLDFTPHTNRNPPAVDKRAVTNVIGVLECGRRRVRPVTFTGWIHEINLQDSGNALLPWQVSAHIHIHTQCEMTTAAPPLLNST